MWNIWTLFAEGIKVTILLNKSSRSRGIQSCGFFLCWIFITVWRCSCSNSIVFMAFMVKIIDFGGWIDILLYWRKSHESTTPMEIIESRDLIWFCLNANQLVRYIFYSILKKHVLQNLFKCRGKRVYWKTLCIGSLVINFDEPKRHDI